MSGVLAHGSEVEALWKPLLGLCEACAAFACKALRAAFVLLVWTEPVLHEINKGDQSREKRDICLHLALPLQGVTEDHPSILSWETTGTAEPGGLQPMGLPRVGHSLVTKQ